MLSGRYLSTTKSTRPPLINPCVAYRNTWSARCENVSPVGRVVWSTAIPSSINAAMGGKSSTGCVPDSSKCKRQDLSVFIRPPSGVASDQGTGPSSYYSAAHSACQVTCFAPQQPDVQTGCGLLAQPKLFFWKFRNRSLILVLIEVG